MTSPEDAATRAMMRLSAYADDIEQHTDTFEAAGMIAHAQRCRDVVAMIRGGFEPDDDRFALLVNGLRELPRYDMRSDSDGVEGVQGPEGEWVEASAVRALLFAAGVDP